MTIYRALIKYGKLRTYMYVKIKQQYIYSFENYLNIVIIEKVIVRVTNTCVLLLTSFNSLILYSYA